MQTLFTITTQNRKIFYQYLKSLSPQALFTIPKGFINNVWWNIAHVVVTEQKLVYGLSGITLPIAQTWVAGYEKGTFPGTNPDQAAVEELMQLLFDLPKQTQTDYNKGLFKHFKPYMTTPKVPLNTVEDALAFNVFHEGLHLGSIMAILRALKA